MQGRLRVTSATAADAARRPLPSSAGDIARAADEHDPRAEGTACPARTRGRSARAAAARSRPSRVWHREIEGPAVAASAAAGDRAGDQRSCDDRGRRTPNRPADAYRFPETLGAGDGPEPPNRLLAAGGPAAARCGVIQQQKPRVSGSFLLGRPGLEPGPTDCESPGCGLRPMIPAVQCRPVALSTVGSLVGKPYAATLRRRGSVVRSAASASSFAAASGCRTRPRVRQNLLFAGFVACRSVLPAVGGLGWVGR